MTTVVKCSTCGAKLQLKQMPRSGKFKCPKCGAVSATNPDAVDDELVGRTLGGHKVQSVISKEGKTTIYKATQISMRRSVALKVLPPERAGAGEAETFLAKAKTAAKLIHPSIVSIYDMGTENEKTYFSMEYVEGTTVGKLIKERGLPPTEDALKMVVETARALSYALGMGIENYTLTPDTVMLSNEGEVKLLSSFITSGQRTAATHVAAIGAFLYHLLTGRPAGPESQRTPARELNPVVSPRIDRIITKMLSTDPESGFVTLDEAIEALNETLHPKKKRVHFKGGGSRSRSSARAARTSAEEDSETDRRPHYTHKKTNPAVALTIGGVCLAVAIAAGIALYVTRAKTTDTMDKESIAFRKIVRLLEAGEEEEALEKCKEFKRKFGESGYTEQIDKQLPTLEKNVAITRQKRDAREAINKVLDRAQKDPDNKKKYTDMLDKLKKDHSDVPDIGSMISTAKETVKGDWESTWRWAKQDIQIHVTNRHYKLAMAVCKRVKRKYEDDEHATEICEAEEASINRSAGYDFRKVRTEAAELIENENYNKAISLYQFIVDHSTSEYAEKAKEKIREIRKQI